MYNRTFVVDQIKKEGSHLYGVRQFKTTFRQGIEYLNRDRQIKAMHGDLIKLKQIQKSKNQLANMHRLGYKVEVDYPQWFEMNHQ